MDDITFIEHQRGFWGSMVFCDCVDGTFHINAEYNYQTVYLKSDEKPYIMRDNATNLEQLWKALKVIEWYLDNMEKILAHETIHVLIYTITNSIKASHQFDDMERSHNLSEFVNYV